MNGDAVEIMKHIDKKVGPLYEKLDTMDRRLTAKNSEQDIILERHSGKLWLLWRILMWVIGPTGILGILFIIFKEKIMGG